MKLSSRKPLVASWIFVQLATAVPAADSSLSPKEVLSILQRRQSSCSTSNPVSCAAVDSKLPSDFCCSSGSSCISLDSSSTALCCPGGGGTCSVIKTIDCNISLQDPSQHASGPVFTTRLSDTLSTCPGSNQCCPFGYSCGTDTKGLAICQIIASKAITKQPTSSTSASVANSSTSSSPKSSATPTTTVAPASPSSIDSTQPQKLSSSNPFPAGVFLAGFFPGILVGALGVLAWVILTGRHKKLDDNASTTSSVFKKKLHISDPVPVDSQYARTDFLRRTNTMAKSAKSLFMKRSPDGGTPGLPFDNWKMPTPPEESNIPVQPVGRQIQAGPGAQAVAEIPSYPGMMQHPVTPERQIYGRQPEQGREMIHVYSPGELETPSAVVAPLRGMNSKRRSTSSGAGNAFVSPESDLNARAHMQQYETNYQTLTPARYQGDVVQKRSRPDTAANQSRPGTTFTDMLEAINFPDPMSTQAPKMPEVPKQYRR